MTVLEICITSILIIAMGAVLAWITCEVIAEKKNATPTMNNDGPKFCEVTNTLIHNMFDYKVKQ